MTQEIEIVTAVLTDGSDIDDIRTVTRADISWLNQLAHEHQGTRWNWMPVDENFFAINFPQFSIIMQEEPV